MSRQDIIFRMRLAGEDFDREFKLKFQELENAAEKQSLAAGARSGGSFAKGFLGAAALGALGAAIGTAIRTSADLGKEIASTSRQFNIGAESLQVWRQAASNAGVSASEFNGSLASLTQKIGAANAGNKTAQQGFVDLGIGFKTTAGQARATDAVMLDLARRIADIKDPAERLRVGTQLLGDEFKTLYPLLLQGAEGFSEAAAQLDRFGGALSAEEIQNLEKTNAKIEEMKNQLSRNIASVVANNADAILGMADSVATLTGQLIKLGSEYPRVSGILGGALLGSRAGPYGALAGAAVGLGVGDMTARSIEDANPDLTFRVARVREAQRRLDLAQRSTGSDRVRATLNVNAERELIRQTELLRQATAAFRGQSAPSGLTEAVTAPRVSAGGGASRRSGAGRNPAQTEAEHEAERAAKEAIRNEEQLRDAIARTLRAQQDSANVQRIRTEQGEEAAAVAEAELNFLRQNPLAVNDTVEALAKALGITKELTQADKDRLQLLIDQGNAAQKAAGEAAGAKARAGMDRELARQEEEARKIAERQAEAYRRLHEQAILDVADFYETAMRGGVDDLWGYFKDEGTRMIAEIAAQWTLAMIAGQPFNFNSAASGALGRSPLASIFMGVGGAANDNSRLPAYIANSPVMQGGGGIAGAALRTAVGGAQTGGVMGGISSIGGAIPQVGMFLAATQLSNSIGGGVADLLGMRYSNTGGSLFGALGGIIGGLLKGSKRGSVTVGNLGGTLGITGSQGNSRSREATATAGAGNLIDAIFQIADQLGGGVDASRGSVSFGMRNNSFRVDPTGRGITRVGNGAVDFGSDQEAAIRFAIQDLIKDGVITGISQASQNLLSRGGDLDAQIEKALLIEQIPKLLRQRFDPLGAAIDEIFDKFKAVNDALVEGSASAEQFAQARELWELEKADAIASIGAASQSLKDFLGALNAGSSSPLSLREQRAEAERQLEPFIGQITAAESARAEVERLRASGASAADIERAEAAARTAAAAINQEGFTQASQLLLSISRQTGASSGAFFSDFDRIRALTGQAIGFVDQAAARDADTRDPFSQAIAQNTQDAAIILSEQSAEIRAQGETLRQIAAALSGGTGSGFIGEARLFTNAA